MSENQAANVSPNAEPAPKSSSSVELPPESHWLDGVIDKLNSLYNQPTLSINNVLSMDDVVAILTYVRRIIDQEGIKICTNCLMLSVVFRSNVSCSWAITLIAGQDDILIASDFCFRTQSLETICLLLALKLRYRDRIFLLRGNHETPAIYGFYDECCRKYSSGIWWEMQSLFNRLPMAGLISKRILCMHGGLSPELTDLNQIRKIVRPCEPQDRGMLIDLLWSDPTNKGDGWFYSPRGISFAFGKGVMAAACKILGIDLVIRAHQVVQDGYEIMVVSFQSCDKQSIEIVCFRAVNSSPSSRYVRLWSRREFGFQAPQYANQFNNAAAVVCIDADLQVSFQQLRIPPTPTCNRPAPPVAADLTAKKDGKLPTFKIVSQQNEAVQSPAVVDANNNNNAQSPGN
ncbi:Serine/threonine-protein phosphatase [Aphelenchoides besseyi]|nr:Serine/threonine-protein phosphatase [Aphelenchoides besseyi]